MVFRAGEFNRCHSRRRGHRLRGHAPRHATPRKPTPRADRTDGPSGSRTDSASTGRMAASRVPAFLAWKDLCRRQHDDRTRSLPLAPTAQSSSCSVDRLTADHVARCIREPRIRRCRPTGSRCERALAVASTEAFHRTDSLPSGGWASRPTTPIASRHKTVSPDTCPEAIPAGAVLADGSLRTRSGAGSSTTGPGPQCPQCRRGTPMTPVPWPVERRGAMLRLENPNNSA